MLPRGRNLCPDLSLEPDANQVLDRSHVYFRSRAKNDLRTASRQAVIAVKAVNVSSFLGKKVTPQLAQEIGSRLSIRFEGTWIKHRMGSVSVKIYDKVGHVLRIETTTAR